MFHISLKNTYGWVLLMKKYSKKVFDGSKLSSKLTLKIKWYHSCGCCDDSQSYEQLKKHITDKYLEKKLWTLITIYFRKGMLPLLYLSDGYLYGIYVGQKFRRILRNSVAYDHDFWYTFVKWWYLQAFFFSFLWNFNFLGC